MRAGQYDLYIERGADYIRELSFYKSIGTPIYLTGVKIEMQIRENTQSNNVICKPEITISDATNGKAVLYISHSDTAKLPAYGKNYRATTEFYHIKNLQGTKTSKRFFL